MSEAASTQQRRARLGQLINLVSDIGLGSPADRSHDILGRVYEYFLSRFAGAEGKKGGQFYTPRHVDRAGRDGSQPLLDKISVIKRGERRGQRARAVTAREVRMHQSEFDPGVPVT